MNIGRGISFVEEDYIVLFQNFIRVEKYKYIVPESWLIFSERF